MLLTPSRSVRRGGRHRKEEKRRLERQFTVWLEHFPPEYYSQAQLAEYEAPSDRWLDEYAKQFKFDR